jgi:Ca2+-binding RTX toxin-like protein
MLSLLAAVVLAAVLGLRTDRALAAYSARIEAGTLLITGDAASDKLVLRLRPAAPDILEVDVGADGTPDFLFDRSTFTAIDVEAGGGDDEVRIDESAGSFADEAVTLDGGRGADTLLDGSGGDTLLGGVGNDAVIGGRGNDTALLGGGDDRFQWNPGDASDVVEGQSGKDQLDFRGSNASETVRLAANGNRLLFTRDVADVVMDTAGVERVDFAALGGTDTVTVNDLAATGVTKVDVDLGVLGDGDTDQVIANGTGASDAVNVSGDSGVVNVTGLATSIGVHHAEPASDRVVVDPLAGDNRVAVNGTAGDDSFDMSGDTSGVVVAGLAAPVAMHHQDGASDALAVNGLGGADTISASALLPQPIALTLDGGTGGDTLGGSQGADMLLGGDGTDRIRGNRGNDTAFMGAGDDTFTWNPGDESDMIDGQAGSDLLDFVASNAGERVDVSADGRRVLLTRDIAGITLGFVGVERLGIHALGSADTVGIGDLTGTDVKSADVDLSGPLGGGDGAADSLVVDGTEKPDVVRVGSAASQVVVSGLAAQVAIAGSEPASDTLLVQTSGGDDDVTVDPSVFGLITAVVDLGPDE